MKSVILFFSMILPFMIQAQLKEGTVIFTETLQLNIELPEDMEEQMKDMIPGSQSYTKSLLFNEKESLYTDYEPAENEDIEVAHESDGMEFKMVMKRPENIHYANLESGDFINSREFFGRMFLIDGTTKNLSWKLTGEQKKVLDYVCQKATFKDDEMEVVAWFTPQIQVSAGPDSFAGLPGLILEVDIDNGERTIVASSVNMEALSADAITAPSKGKKVSKEKFEKIQEEKMKEMETEMGGSGGGMKVIVRND